MTYEKTVRIPADRIGALIGRGGRSKRIIQEACGVKLVVDSRSGRVDISYGDLTEAQPYKAAEIVTAIGRGFSTTNAMLLIRDENRLHVMDLRQFVGKSATAMERIRGRIIGEGGRARRNIEQLGRTRISVYGKTVSIIGDERRLRIVVSAINSLLAGGMHSSAYGRLEAANRRERQERMILWEGQDVIE